MGVIEGTATMGVGGGLILKGIRIYGKSEIGVDKGFGEVVVVVG